LRLALFGNRNNPHAGDRQILFAKHGTGDVRSAGADGHIQIGSAAFYNAQLSIRQRGIAVANFLDVTIFEVPHTFIL
jgi:hypothetical protein